MYLHRLQRYPDLTLNTMVGSATYPMFSALLRCNCILSMKSIGLRVKPGKPDTQTNSFLYRYRCVCV